MTRDPIVDDEVRAIRESLAREHDHDLERILDALLAPREPSVAREPR